MKTKKTNIDLMFDESKSGDVHVVVIVMIVAVVGDDDDDGIVTAVSLVNPVMKMKIVAYNLTAITGEEHGAQEASPPMLPMLPSQVSLLPIVLYQV
jgi:hypothetical protein